MTLFLFALAAVCVVNAPRSRSAVPQRSAGETPASAGLAGLGAAAVLAALVPLAAFADPLLDAGDLSPATARIATGLLLVVSGLLAIGWSAPSPDPALPGPRAALVPIAFPTLLTPGLALLSVVGSVDHAAPVALGVVAVALATLPVLVALARRPPTPVRERVLEGLGRLVAGLLVLAGFGLLFDGVFDI
jgi:small neutral amino acid transporter SnatA (MarC family)